MPVTSSSARRAVRRLPSTKSSTASAPLAARALQHDLRAERQPDRRAVGRRRGVAQVAGDGAGVLDLHAADFARRLLQRVEERRQVGAQHVGPGGGGAESSSRDSSRRMPRRPCDAREVEQRRRRSRGRRAPGRGRCRRRAAAGDPRASSRAASAIDCGRSKRCSMCEALGLRRPTGMNEVFTSLTSSI